MNTPETRGKKRISEYVMDLQALEQEEAEHQRAVAHIQSKRWKIHRQLQAELNGGADPRLF